MFLCVSPPCPLQLCDSRNMIPVVVISSPRGVVPPFVLTCLCCVSSLPWRRHLGRLIGVAIRCGVVLSLDLSPLFWVSEREDMC